MDAKDSYAVTEHLEPSDAARSSTTLVELLQRRAQLQPDQPAYTYLNDGDTHEVHLTYQELDMMSRAVAAQLQQYRASGQRALLLYPPGLDYIVAFFGCLYAGVVAVPAYPPRPNQSFERLLTILQDAQATLLLSTEAILSRLQGQFAAVPQMQHLLCLATDQLPPEAAQDWQHPDVHSTTLAFLQYPSGSTASPRGVMITHAQLLHNQRLIQQGCQQPANPRVVGWLPLYHDMGLIGNVLHPLYLGVPCWLMSPVAFLE